MRLLVALPAVATDWPATHIVWLTQGVDGLPSLSHVPAAQAWAAAVPPAQN